MCDDVGMVSQGWKGVGVIRLRAALRRHGDGPRRERRRQGVRRRLRQRGVANPDTYVEKVLDTLALGTRRKSKRRGRRVVRKPLPCNPHQQGRRAAQLLVEEVRRRPRAREDALVQERRNVLQKKGRVWAKRERARKQREGARYAR